MKSTILYYSDLATGGTSDKEYRIQITKTGSGYHVQFQFGRRGGTLQSGVKTSEPVPLEEAERIFDRLAHEKVNKGYLPNKGETALAPALIEKANAAGKTQYPVELLEEISREAAEDLIKSTRYWLQVKVDGHRRQVEKLSDGTIISYNRKGQPTSLPSEVANELNELSGKNGVTLKTFLMDGELVGSWFIAFDLLKANGVTLTPMTYAERFRELERIIGKGSPFVTSVATWKAPAEKQAGLAELFKNRSEGAVFKLTTAPYRPGRNGQHKKMKFIKSCTCKVLALGTNGHDNATLGLLDGKKWVDVGGASMIGKDKRIKVGSLVEILFLYATEGKRLYQPRIKELRDDVKESDCTFAQLKNAWKEGVAA